MKISIHAGHNPDGKVACGAAGEYDGEKMSESSMAREIVKELMRLFADVGTVEVRDITVNNGYSQMDVLNRLVAEANAYGGDLNISIHLNSSASVYANGVECWLPDNASPSLVNLSNMIVDKLSDLGYRKRETRYGKLYITRNMSAPTILIECGFVSNTHDNVVYREFGARSIAEKIYDSIMMHYFSKNTTVYYRVMSQPLVYKDALALAGKLNEMEIYNEIHSIKED